MTPKSLFVPLLNPAIQRGLQRLNPQRFNTVERNWIVYFCGRVLR